MPNDKLKWILLIVLSIIWGSSFILIKKSLIYFTPYQVGGLRVFISALVLLPIAIKEVKKFPKDRLKWLIIAALCGNFIPMFLFPIAETEVSSSIAGIINSMMPIFVIIVGSLAWHTPTSKTQMYGVVISFLGACILAFGNSGLGELKLIPILLLLLATLLYAISTTTVKAKLHDIPAKILSSFVFGFVLLIPSLLALVFSGFFSTFSVETFKWEGLAYVATLSIFGTGLAMMLNYKLLHISTPLFASTVTLVMPIVAVIWGFLDGETLTPIQYFGGIMILAGLIFLRTKTTKKITS